MLPGARQDNQLVTDKWQKLQDSIAGVYCREVLHVPRDHGVITEVFRPAWDPTGLPVVQVYQSRLFPGAIGAWSCHEKSIDRLFVNQGHVKVVLFDGREGSRTWRMINEFHVGDARPTFLVIPTGVWHGLQNLGASEALILNLPTKSYDYGDPDHYRLPYDTPEIPYSWGWHGSSPRLRADGKRD
jgi:dTDP-4-dehydrorhamnose 3,5-epimerase